MRVRAGDWEAAERDTATSRSDLDLSTNRDILGPTRTSEISKTNITRISVELGALITGLLVQVIEWKQENTTNNTAHGFEGRCLVSGYLILIASARLLLRPRSSVLERVLWMHSIALYGFLWLLGTVVLRSQLLLPPDGPKALHIWTFFLHTILFASLLFESNQIKYTKDIENSQRTSNEYGASVFSLATFTWIDRLTLKAYKKTIDIQDVWKLVPTDEAAYVLAQYRLLRSTSSLAWRLLRHFRALLLLQAGWAVLSGVITFVPTLLLKAILEYLEDPLARSRNAAWLWVGLLLVSGLAAALTNSQSYWWGRKLSVRIQAILVGELYAKTLKRKIGVTKDKVLGGQKVAKGNSANGAEDSKDAAPDVPNDRSGKTSKEDDADGQVTSGAIINLMATDTFKVSEVTAYMHYLWALTPVQLVIAVYLLYQLLGFSSIAGMLMMLVLLPINIFFARQFTKIQKRLMTATDARIHITNEVLQNIRIIKYFAWERRYVSMIDEKRTVEVKFLRRRYLVWMLAATLWMATPIIITFFSFFILTVVEKKELVPSVAFPALSLFAILRAPLDQLADMLAHVQEAKVSVDRIEEYLSEAETEKYEQLSECQLQESGEPLIGFFQASFNWGKPKDGDKQKENTFQLIDLNAKFTVGRLNLIVGPTGSGKSSLLMALLGEMTLLNGSISFTAATNRENLLIDAETGLTESVAYCAQQAWLSNGTIKNNILFASPWDKDRYHKVIDICALTRDLEILEAGDETLVGEKGVALSGGQKQRISLARALYSPARHVVLDDVLSAVDSHTARWIFEKALIGPFMRKRTCILVTHNVTLCLPHAENVLVLDNGRIAIQGRPEIVMSSGKLGENTHQCLPTSTSASKTASQAHSTAEEPKTSVQNGLDSSFKPVETELKERKAEGSVKPAIIFFYLKSMGSWLYWVTAAIFFVAQQISNLSTNLWIRRWANAYEEIQSGDFIVSSNSSQKQRISQMPYLGALLHEAGIPRIKLNIPGVTSISRSLESLQVKPNYYLIVYAGLGLAYILICLPRQGILFAGSINASRTIHRQLIDNIVHANFQFFDVTPLGQLMNRFSKDIEAIDQEVAPIADGVVSLFLTLIIVLLVISFIIPIFLVAAIFITITFVAISALYINLARDLKRIESTQRSPLIQHFGETLQGITTIRAYGDEARFFSDNLKRLNTRNRPYIHLWALNRWLSVRVDTTGALVSFSTAAFMLARSNVIDAGAAGLAMAYAVTFTESVLWFVRLYGANEQMMNSVERVKEYLDVEQEGAQIVEDRRPPANWPMHGKIEFIGYSTRYRKELGEVLKKVTFKILPGEKVGVVGRTGAGKSSLALALFRALEAVEGTILIDDIDIALIGLQDLRQSIVMVPQGKGHMLSFPPLRLSIPFSLSSTRIY